MSAVLEYVRSFLTLFLLIKVLLAFVPKNGFSKYISFFSGLILVIGMLYPALQLFQLDEKWLETVQYDSFEEKMLEASFLADDMQVENLGIYKAQIENFVASEIRSRVEEAGFCVEKVEVSLSTDCEIEKLFLTVTDGNEEEYPVLKEKIVKEYQLEKAQCEIAYE